MIKIVSQALGALMGKADNGVWWKDELTSQKTWISDLAFSASHVSLGKYLPFQGLCLFITWDGATRKYIRVPLYFPTGTVDNVGDTVSISGLGRFHVLWST